MNKGAILVIRGGAMGDFIVTLPVLAALRNAFPETRLEVVGYPSTAQLALAGGLVQNVRAIESRGLAGYFARSGPLDPDWAAYFAGFNIILSYLYDPDEFFRGNVTRVTRAQFIQGPHAADELSSIPIAEQLLVPLQRLAIFGADAVPSLSFPKPAIESAAVELAVHPGSSSEQKNWPEARWVELLGELRKKSNLRILLIGGEAEGGKLDRLARLFPDRCEVWFHRPLTELAARLTRANGFVGHDSGPGHLAAALGLPGITLWGKTNSNIWRPQSSKFHLIEAGSNLPQLPAGEVLRAISRMLGI